MKKLDTGSKLFVLWLFVMLNYIYCDIMGLFDPKVLGELLSGFVGEMPVTPGFLLGASILMEIPIVMVLLSKLLSFKANRLANIIGGIVMTLVQAMSLFVGEAAIYYIFFSIIEISCTSAIAYIAWRWKE